MSLPIVLTDAGRAALVNAQNTGSNALVIANAQIGSGNYTPSKNQASLHTAFKTISTISGVITSADTISVTIKDISTDAYEVKEIGFFTDAGILFAVMSQPEGSLLIKTADNWLLATFDIKFTSVDVSNVTFGDAIFAYPKASEEQVKSGKSTAELVGPESMYFLIKRQKMNFFNLNLMRGI